MNFPARHLYCYLWIFLISLVVICSSTPSIYLSSPTIGSKYILPDSMQKNAKAFSIPVEYTLFGLTGDSKIYDVCIEIVDSKTSTVLISIEKSCFPYSTSAKPEENEILALSDNVPHLLPISHTNRELSMIPAGEYRLSAVVYLDNEPIDGSRVTHTFSILSNDDLVPKVSITSTSKVTNNNGNGAADDLEYVASMMNGLATFSVDFSVSGGVSSPDHIYAPCIVLRNKQFTVSNDKQFSWSCLGPRDRQFSANNVGIGQWLLHMALRDERSNAMVASSEITKTISIYSLEEALPLIKLVNPLQEYGVEESGVAKVQLQYEVVGVPSAVSQVVACLELVQLSDGKTAPAAALNKQLIRYSCLSPTDNVIYLNNMAAGEYVAKLSLSLSTNKASMLSPHLQVPVPANIVIKPMEEFVPSYEWQTLHAWHTIPSGIETRLPVGGLSRKEARIPEPWRLQLPLPSPCKYFLRMDIRRETTVRSIRDRAADKCKKSPECFVVRLDDGNVELTDEETAESTGLFLRTKEIHWVGDSNDSLCSDNANNASSSHGDSSEANHDSRDRDSASSSDSGDSSNSRESSDSSSTRSHSSPQAEELQGESSHQLLLAP